MLQHVRREIDIQRIIGLGCELYRVVDDIEAEPVATVAGALAGYFEARHVVTGGVQLPGAVSSGTSEIEGVAAGPLFRQHPDALRHVVDAGALEIRLC